MKNNSALLSSASDGKVHCCNSTVKHRYLNFPEDMDEDDPLIWKTSKKDKMRMASSCSQSTVKHPTLCSCKTIDNAEGIPCHTKPGDHVAN